MKRIIYGSSIAISVWLWCTIPLTWLLICGGFAVYLILESRKDVI